MLQGSRTTKAKAASTSNKKRQLIKNKRRGLNPISQTIPMLAASCSNFKEKPLLISNKKLVLKMKRMLELRKKLQLFVRLLAKRMASFYMQPFNRQPWPCLFLCDGLSFYMQPLVCAHNQNSLAKLLRSGSHLEVYNLYIKWLTYL